MRRIVLTGATGFVGANLARALLILPDIELCITTRQSSDKWRIAEVSSDFYRMDYIDLTNREEVFAYIAEVKPQLIYHVATYGGLPDQTDAEATIRSNLQATMHLIDAAVVHNVEQFIHTGTSSEYGVKHYPMREEDICHPLSLYGISKLAATHYVSLIGKTSPMKTCTLRLFSPYGPYEAPSRLYASIVNALKNNEQPRLSRPSSVRDFIPIKQVTDIYIRMAQVDYKSGSIINVGSGKQQTLADFYRTIAAELGKSNIEPIWGQAAPRANEPVVWEADISLLRKILNS